MKDYCVGQMTAGITMAVACVIDPEYGLYAGLGVALAGAIGWAWEQR